MAIKFAKITKSENGVHKTVDQVSANGKNNLKDACRKRIEDLCSAYSGETMIVGFESGRVKGIVTRPDGSEVEFDTVHMDRPMRPNAPTIPYHDRRFDERLAGKVFLVTEERFADLKVGDVIKFLWVKNYGHGATLVVEDIKRKTLVAREIEGSYSAGVQWKVHCRSEFYIDTAHLSDERLNKLLKEWF